MNAVSSTPRPGNPSPPPVVPSAATARPGSNHCEHQPAIDQLRSSLGGVLEGKQGVIEKVLICLLARGHLLLEDLPGLGKTTLAKALAEAVGGRFARVQCTPDLLPGDITGFNVFNPKSREFDFVPGPIFTDVLLADEINRATPRTQSALFEAMSERQTTVDNVCRSLPTTFFVVATQNPIEQRGTFPLPEAQLDRFMMKLSIGYPEAVSEVAMLRADSGNGEERPTVRPILSPASLASLQQHVRQVSVAENVREYLVELGRATRVHPEVSIGASPRALILWQRASQARAHLAGRDFVLPDDVREVAHPVLSVRLLGMFESAGQVIDSILDRIAVPTALPKPSKI